MGETEKRRIVGIKELEIQYEKETKRKGEELEKAETSARQKIKWKKLLACILNHSNERAGESFCSDCLL